MIGSLEIASSCLFDLEKSLQLVTIASYIMLKSECGGNSLLDSDPLLTILDLPL